MPNAAGSSYPDFIEKLIGSRILVAEYKGEHLVRMVAKKCAVGEIWHAASDGQGVYVCAQKDVSGKSVCDQVSDAIAAGA